jgi:putative ABC transport system permease protein
MSQPRLIAQLLGGFPLLAVVMSTMGVYMVVTYLTSRRTKEVALRRAIGAESLDVLRLLTGQTMRWMGVGLVLGLAGAVAASGALQAVLRGLTHLDLGTVAAIGAFYLLVVAVAVWVPTAKALRRDPAAVLRSE